VLSGVQRARIVTSTELTGAYLDVRLEGLRDRIRARDNGRRRRSIAALTTALLGGTFQLARAKDTGRWAGGINTMTSVFVADFNTLAPGSDGEKSDAREFEDAIARYAPLVIVFRSNYGETVSDQVLRSARSRADRSAREEAGACCGVDTVTVSAI